MQRAFENLITWRGSAAEALIQQVELLQAQAGGPQGYRLRRIILTNFWLYGQQELEIPHGRLFLAGENASGKSTVLTAALPLALDGDLHPNRLDTFGGRERHIEYYVLGSDKSATPFNYERRTSYIALEFEWCHPDQPPFTAELRQVWEKGEREKARFLTIGISLAGNVNASNHIRAMRFLITDGSRLGYDIPTVSESGNGANRERRASDQTRFKQMLEGHGIVCETQDEYERQVARSLFGFTEVKDFRKLIDLLLILRRPNLSSELSFSRVHEHLKQSLRKIPGETTQRVTGTIERIDAIQSEIDHIQEAFNSCQRLHQVQQSLTLAEAKLAACDYTGAQLAENGVQSQANRLRKELHNAEDEHSRALARRQDLVVEGQQVSGQIKALEGSEGLQVAERLTRTRTRVKETTEQARGQEQSLLVARRSISTHEQEMKRLQASFSRVQQTNEEQLRALAETAEQEALWNVAALQLRTALERVSTMTLDSPSMPEAPPVHLLGSAQARERLKWLHALEEVHSRREKLDAEVQHARALENTRFSELDEARNGFQSAQDRTYTAQQALLQALNELIAHSEFVANSPRALEAPATEGLAEDTSLEDEARIEGLIQRFASAIGSYRQAIDALDQELGGAEARLQDELEALQQSTGSKTHEIAEIEHLYQQKQAEPEIAPQRSQRRNKARATLAERGIPALPLYALIDFAPGIDSEQAGRIERMLEDAGLLDALVVAPAQVAFADALLVAEGLSDCRLDVAQVQQLDDNETIQPWLRYDPAAHDYPQSGDSDWEAITRTVLPAIGSHNTMRHVSAENSITGPRIMLDEDGSWRHGLLSGQAGTGAATGLIGKANRLRVRQQELDALNEKRAALAEELRLLAEQIAGAIQQRTRLQQERTRLRKFLPDSGLEQRHAELLYAQKTLSAARSRYQQAHRKTQEVRQSLNTLNIRLERECVETPAFASGKERVKEAIMAMVTLENQVRSLQRQLESSVETWKDYQNMLLALEDARTEAERVAALCEQSRSQVLQAQAELAELQRMAELQNVAELSERLRTLRERSESLSLELNDAIDKQARTEERARNMAERLAEAEDNLARVRQVRVDKQTHFSDLLASYAMAQLAQASQLTRSGDYNGAAQKILGETLHASDVTVRKEQLENAWHVAHNVLTRVFNQESHVLHDYGPDLDDQGRILFLKENRSSPFVLLEILAEKIGMQRDLLGREERELFEDFLLQEMAEAIRTHIFEAEEWVQQINKVLSGLPMIGEHYLLEWKPASDFDPTKLGSHLALHYKLLRKPSQTLTSQESSTLMDAFKQEINAVRVRQKEDPTLNFMEALELIFDYREWFHFDIYVTPTGGQRQRLTDRVAGTRSGAEQLFALYVPLFAALAALYKSAAPGAPRLLALDEAFDKASSANTLRIMEFLASQDFQWIMTGPRIDATGSRIPVSARYLMLHEKGSPVATASASFWSGNQTTQESQSGEQNDHDGR
ncbi:MAG: TIGR02680 family protein [Ktedonobacteraceae bacterium]